MARKEKFLEGNKDKKIIKNLEKFLDYRFGQLTMKYNKDQSMSSISFGPGIVVKGDSVVGLRMPIFGKGKFLELPEDIRGLTNLIFLDLTSQKYKDLPEWLKELVNLELLYLERNQLTFIPECLKELINLTVLDLSDNQITSLPEWLMELKSLRTLVLGGNRNFEVNQKNIDVFKALDNKIKNMPGLFALNIKKGVPKEQIEIINDLLKINNFVDDFKIVYWKDFDEEFKSDYEDQHIIDIRTKEGEIAKIGIIGPKYGSKRIKTLPENFGELKHLPHFTLRNHKLESLPNSFGDLLKLEVLDLSKNSLKSLPDSFINLTSITKLNLSVCQFTKIPEQLWAFKELTELKMDNNPLSNEENNIIENTPELIREYLRKKATIRIFISHAVIDFEPYRIGDLVDYLEKQKEISQVFFCEEDLAGNIDEWMLDAIQKCQLILFIGTNKSVFKSVDCANELQLADKFSIPVIPLKCKDVDWPDLAERNLSRELGLEYDTENFDDFCSNVYKYIENIKREINLLEKEERRLGIMNIYERFRLMLNEKLSEMFRKMDDLAKKIEKIDDLAEIIAKLEEKVN